MRAYSKVLAITCLAACVIAIITAGCSGYRLGSTLPPGIETLYVPTFKNETGEPNIETRTTAAAILEFQRDGTLKITGEDEADAVLTVTISRYYLQPLRFDRNRSKAAKEYRLRLKADVVLTKRGEENPMLETYVNGDTTFEMAGDMSSAKRDALPEAARDLAHDIVELVVEYWE